MLSFNSIGMLTCDALHNDLGSRYERILRLRQRGMIRVKSSRMSIGGGGEGGGGGKSGSITE